MQCCECGSPATCSVTNGQNRQKVFGFGNSVKVDNLTRYYCNNCVESAVTGRSKSR